MHETHVYENSYEKAQRSIEHWGNIQLDKIEAVFAFYSPELGKKARQLIKTVTASFGVRPDENKATLFILCEQIEKNTLDFDREKNLFFISDGQQSFYLDPFRETENREGTILLTEEMLQFAEYIHRIALRGHHSKATIHKESLNIALYGMSERVGNLLTSPSSP